MDKDNRLGFDPLSWLKNEENNEKNTKKTKVSKKNADSGSRSARKLPKKKDNAVKETGTHSMQSILKESLELLAPQGEALTKEFYKRLFANYPQVKPLFAKVDMDKQGSMLLAAVQLAVNNLDNPEILKQALTEMGKRHQQYGALPEHYPAVAETMLQVMSDFAGDNWSEELSNAWSDALDFVAQTMIAAYESEESNMAARKSTGSNTPKIDADTHAELVRAGGIVNSINAAIMMVDTDLKIVTMNPAAQKMMKSVESIMRETFPKFDADNLIGVCIDDFHKNPEHQRRLLSSPENLPYTGYVRVGPLTMGLSVTAVFGLDGSYIGACQEWVDKTQEIKNEIMVSRMQSAIEGSQTACMLCDQDLNIIYMNKAVKNLLKAREQDLQNILPSFKVDNLIGSNIDQFHQNPSHQRGLLSDPSRLPYATEIKVLDMHFGLSATMLTDEDGNYLGNAVEWTDRTDERNTEEKISTLIESVSNGVLDQRLDVSNSSGFLLNLGNQINELVDSVEQPTLNVLKAMEAIERGDLTEQMTGEYAGTFASLRDTVNNSMSSLAQMVGEIRIASGQIASAASEISQGNTDLSQRTEEQASSLEETASSMEQLTSTVSQNADNSKQANRLAADARAEAEEGGQVIESTINAMTEINTSSTKIEDIISVIDEIAFQTNLLALNAAVEAARAGEQGRGFAVVASEVRSLAQRSAAAAKEIKMLIKDSVEKVDEGTRLVDESGQTLRNLVSSVKKVSDIIAEIAAASSEQASGIGQVGKAITQLDEVTQQNAALVEEAAAASESLDEQAKSLTDQMQFFQVGDNEGTEQVAEPVRTVTSTSRPGPAPKRAASPVKATPARASSAIDDDDEWENF